MTSIDRLLQQLQSLQVRLRIDGAQLRFEAPPGVMNPELLESLKRHKTELLQLLQRTDSRAAAAPEGSTFPVSFEQARLLFGSAYSDSSMLQLPLAIRIRGPLDVQRLQRAIDLLVERHETLRTVYAHAGDRGWRQQVLAPRTVSLKQVKIAAPEEEAHGRIQSAAQDFLREPFDLTRDLPLRAVLFRIGPAEDHVLILSVHHIAADATSSAILLRELNQGFSGELPHLNANTAHYTDYATSQRLVHADQSFSARANLYADALRGYPPVHGVPLDRPRPGTQHFHGAHLRTYVEQDLVTSLVKLSRSHNTSLFPLLHAAYAALIARYSGDSDIVVGVPMSTRPERGFDCVVGCFINMVALPARVDARGSFASLLNASQEVLSRAHDWRAIPIDEVIDRLGQPRQLSHHPVFQITLGLQPNPYALNLDGLHCEEYPLPVQTSRFDLGLDLRPHARGLIARWEYDRALFESGTVERLARHYTNLLNSIVRAPDTPIGQLDFQDASERPARRAAARMPPDSLLARWNQVVRDYADSTALIISDARITFRQLDDASAYAARQFLDMNVTAGSCIGISTEVRLETYVALLAAVRIGTAYVPLDPSLPATRLNAILEAARIGIVTGGDVLADALPSNSTAFLLPADRLLPAGHHVPSLPQLAAADCDWPAYIMFTSGTAGRPKGVMVTQGAIARLALQEPRIRVEAGSTCLQAASLAFDASTYEIWGTWLNGGCVLAVEKERLLDPALFRHVLIEHTPQTCFLTTALLNRFAETCPEELACFHRILFGGEAVSNRHVGLIRQACPAVELIHVYGPTENTTFSTAHILEADEPRDASPVRIGTALQGDITHVLTSQLEPTHIGGIGELLVGGPGLAIGYVGMPRLTAQKFIPNPYAARPGERLYRTGDLVRRHDGESYSFVRRIDQQVKVNGFRIELAEVEEWVQRLPEVADVAAVVRETEHGARQLVAYVVLTRGAQLSAEELRDRAFAQAPAYIRPHRIILVPELPLNANGKVDVAALPDEQQSAEPESEPLTSDEQSIVSIWRTAAGIEAGSPHADFFVCGGDSLGAMAVCHALRAELRVEVPLREFFASPTPRSLAAVVRDAPRTAPAVVREFEL